MIEALDHNLVTAEMTRRIEVAFTNRGKLELNDKRTNEVGLEESYNKIGYRMGQLIDQNGFDRPIQFSPIPRMNNETSISNPHNFAEFYKIACSFMRMKGWDKYPISTYHSEAEREVAIESTINHELDHYLAIFNGAIGNPQPRFSIEFVQTISTGEIFMRPSIKWDEVLIINSLAAVNLFSSPDDPSEGDKSFIRGVLAGISDPSKKDFLVVNIDY